MTPGRIIATHIGPAPMRSTPDMPCSSALISDSAWRYSSSICFARRASTSPGLVKRDAGRQALEQRHADGLFQLPDAARQRGLTDIERLGRRRDVALLDHAEEMTEQAANA